MRAAKKSVVITDGTGDILQIVICLFACDYLRYIVLQYVEPRIPENLYSPGIWVIHSEGRYITDIRMQTTK